MYYNKGGKTKKKIFIFIIFIAIVALLVHSFLRDFKKEETYVIKGNGRIEARETVVSSKFGGKIVEIKVDEGAYVQKGDILAVIDSESYSASISAQKANLEQIYKQINSTASNIKEKKSDVNYRKKEIKRTQALIEKSFSTQSELDKNTNDLEKAEAQLASLEATKKALESSAEALKSTIKSMEIDLNDRNIVAPSDGFILYRLVEDGELIQNGGKLFVMYNPDDLYMTIYMSSNNAGQVKIGDEALIKLDAYPDKTFSSKVTFVAENSEFTPKEVETPEERVKLVFRIKLTLDDNSEREAKPGMPGNGYIKLDDDKDWPTLK